MILKIDSKVNSEDITPLLKYVVPEASEYFNVEAGNNHCKLLSYLSKQLPDNSLICDLGTLYGQSAVALAANPKVNVVTFDIVDLVGKDRGYNLMPNVKYIQGDCIEYIRDYSNSDIVFLDVAPHDGIQEIEIVTQLIAYDFRGILICDDIYYNDEMKAFWNTFEEKKFDVSKYGHWSGTGVVVFNPSYLDIEVEQ